MRYSKLPETTPDPVAYRPTKSDAYCFAGPKPRTRIGCSAVPRRRLPSVLSQAFRSSKAPLRIPHDLLCQENCQPDLYHAPRDRKRKDSERKNLEVSDDDPHQYEPHDPAHKTCLHMRQLLAQCDKARRENKPPDHPHASSCPILSFRTYHGSYPHELGCASTP